MLFHPVTVPPDARLTIVTGSPSEFAGSLNAAEPRAGPPISENLLITDDRIAAAGRVSRVVRRHTAGTVEHVGARRDAEWVPGGHSGRDGGNNMTGPEPAPGGSAHPESLFRCPTNVNGKSPSPKSRQRLAVSGTPADGTEQKIGKAVPE
ncbi:hypothetical protein F4562_001582 [Streptosporangium becharense]|uniref:Uncharacterized protein n=1 Tax=Streptosporangium becharense TaxID=1816182 RepID=A0A7W9ID55_9ACTN|nr:hypothetical protein [Streptosporangium becharense]MBB5818520.1 hypothetical protein [Streptosporangium becharense]